MATEIQFDPAGKPLKVEIRCGHAQAGAYDLKLWDTSDNVMKLWEGTFFNPNDDTYTLPGKVAAHDGRLVGCRFSVELIPPIKKYALMMTISQGDQVLGTVTRSGETDEEEIMKSAFARLKAK